MKLQLQNPRANSSSTHEIWQSNFGNGIMDKKLKYSVFHFLVIGCVCKDSIFHVYQWIYGYIETNSNMHSNSNPNVPSQRRHNPPYSETCL